MSESAPATVSLLEQLGARALHVSKVTSGLWVTWVSAWRSAQAPGEGARQVCRAIAMRQIFYTSFQALGLISVVALFIGATLIVQTELLGGALNRETAGRVLVAVVLRELAPLVTAILVAGRSGTAIATELGVMRVNSEVLALASLGIDPPRFLVWPRMVATMVSVPILTVYFSAMAVMGGFVAALMMDVHGVGDWQSGVTMGLTPADIPLFLTKSAGLGALVGWLCSYYGLDVGVSPTEVPVKASRAVVQTLLACIVFNAIVTGVFYVLLGGRLA
ncbi:MAG TPA: ABC transporter permease [Polyangiaceae bacterium]|nr:ABC transporter permease [Polyangiaceae bacterium]